VNVNVIHKKTGMFPLYMSLKEDLPLEVFEKLLERGADINQQTLLGNTSLISSAAFEDLEALRFFIDHDADGSLQNAAGDTVLHAALQTQYSRQLVPLIVQKYPSLVTVRNKKGQIPLHIACSRPNLAISVLDALSTGEDGSLINTPDGSGRSPLMIASALVNGELVKYLVEEGADLKQTDSLGKTALLHSLDSHCHSCVQWLTPSHLPSPLMNHVLIQNSVKSDKDSNDIMNEGIVLSVGPNTKSLHIGDDVLLPETGGNSFNIEGQEFMIYNDKDILGVFDESKTPRK